jgi:hypothetical protein
MARITWKLVGSDRVRIHEVGPVTGGQMAAEQCVVIQIEQFRMPSGTYELEIVEPDYLAGRYRVERLMDNRTYARRRALLEFVAEHSPDGRPFRLGDALKGGRQAIRDEIGARLLDLACDDLCGVEDPDIVWSTDAGLAWLEAEKAKRK